MPATGAGEEETGVEPWRMLGERLSGSQGQRDGLERAPLLAVQLLAPIREDAPDVDDARLAVDVGARERDPLLGP